MPQEKITRKSLEIFTHKQIRKCKVDNENVSVSVNSFFEWDRADDNEIADCAQYT